MLFACTHLRNVLNFVRFSEVRILPSAPVYETSRANRTVFARPRPFRTGRTTKLETGANAPKSLRPFSVEILTRAAYPRRRSSNANSLWWRALARPTRVVMLFQIHGWRTDSGVRVSPPQPRSRLFTPGLVRESSVAHSKAQALRAGRLSHCRVSPSGPNHGRKDLDGRGCHPHYHEPTDQRRGASKRASSKSDPRRCDC
jgi:hypothetical protein